MWAILNKDNKEIIGLLLPDTPIEVVQEVSKNYFLVTPKEGEPPLLLGTTYNGIIE
jgi:hypothetical protein